MDTYVLIPCQCSLILVRVITFVAHCSIATHRDACGRGRRGVIILGRIHQVGGSTQFQCQFRNDTPLCESIAQQIVRLGLGGHLGQVGNRIRSLVSHTDVTYFIGIGKVVTSIGIVNRNCPGNTYYIFKSIAIATHIRIIAVKIGNAVLYRLTCRNVHPDRKVTEEVPFQVDTPCVPFEAGIKQDTILVAEVAADKIACLLITATDAQLMVLSRGST